MTMPEMTDEEADYWDEYFTANPPKLGPNGADFLSLREVSLLGMNDLSINYLKTRAEATHQSLGQVINALVREKVAAGA
jgi:hypothetical protein